MTRPAVLFGGPSPEHDISVLTGLQAIGALAKVGREPISLYWARSGDFFEVDASLEPAAFVDGVPRGAQRVELVARPDGGFVREAGRLGKRAAVVFGAIVNCCHGGPGEDGTLQGAFDLAGIRYSGPTAAGAALGMDKLAFGGLMATAGLRSLPRVAFDAERAPGFAGPYIVKPRFGGSSIGIEITDDVSAIAALVRTSPHYRAGAVVEPYLGDAVDLNISVLTHPTLRLSAIERPLRGAVGTAIYSYADKYLGGEGMASAKRELPAQLPDAVRDEIVDTARRVVDLACVRSVARIDFLWADDQVFVNEINTIPGSLSWYLWAPDGLSFPALLEALIEEAERTSAASYSTDGADGSALRAAGSIASKLA